MGSVGASTLTVKLSKDSLSGRITVCKVESFGIWCLEWGWNGLILWLPYQQNSETVNSGAADSTPLIFSVLGSGWRAVLKIALKLHSSEFLNLAGARS